MPTSSSGYFYFVCKELRVLNIKFQRRNKFSNKKLLTKWLTTPFGLKLSLIATKFLLLQLGRVPCLRPANSPKQNAVFSFNQNIHKIVLLKKGTLQTLDQSTSLASLKNQQHLLLNIKVLLYIYVIAF